MGLTFVKPLQQIDVEWTGSFEAIIVPGIIEALPIIAENFLIYTPGVFSVYIKNQSL